MISTGNQHQPRSAQKTAVFGGSYENLAALSFDRSPTDRYG